MSHIINIEWSGPNVLDSLPSLLGDTAFGIYQVYGPHPVYCSQQLLYIGQASARTFAVRTAEHEWMKHTRDSSQTAIYVGRLRGLQTPDDQVWKREIDLAECLLIYAHFPPYNTQKWSAENNPNLRDVHVLNWGKHRDLLPEVSGARHMPLQGDALKQQPYSNREFKSGKF